MYKTSLKIYVTKMFINGKYYYYNIQYCAELIITSTYYTNSPLPEACNLYE